jgi:hypothetical protein
MGILITDSKTGKILKDDRSGDISGGYRSPKKKKKKKKESSRTILDADRKMAEEMLNSMEFPGASEMFIKRNDGGIARKTRVF